MIFKKVYSQNNFSLELTNKDHIKQLIEYSLDKKFYRYLEYIPFTKQEVEDYFIKKIISKKVILFTIFFNKRIVGTFSINNYNNKTNSCLIGYGINPKYWGKGIFNKLIKIVIKKIFIKKKQKIYVITRIDNYSSIVGLIKNDFKILKLLKNFYYDKKTKKRYDAFKLKWIRS